MPDIMKILQQAQQMQGRLKQIQDELEARTVNAASGGGMVTVEADGKGQIRKIKIDPTVVNASDVEMLEDLILVAVVEAQKKAADLAQEEMGKLAGGMNLPFKLALLAMRPGNRESRGPAAGGPMGIRCSGRLAERAGAVRIAPFGSMPDARCPVPDSVCHR